MLKRGHPVRQRAKPAQTHEENHFKGLFTLRAQADRMSDALRRDPRWLPDAAAR
jgi:hypothetical protein